MIITAPVFETIEASQGNLSILMDELEYRASRQSDVDTAVKNLRWDEGMDTLEGHGFQARNITEHAFSQLCSRLSLPANYIRSVDPDLRAQCVNRAIAKHGGELKIRMQADAVRGIVGPRYAPVGHIDVLRRVLNSNPNAMGRYMLTDTTLDLQVISLRENTDPGHAGSVIRTGLHVRNSEVGVNSLSLSGLLFRTICLNGLILQGGTGEYRRRHVGDSGDIINTMSSHISSTMDAAEKFGGGFRNARGIIVPREKTGPAIDALAKTYELGKDEVTAIKSAFQEEYGETLYDVLNAFTRAGTHNKTLGQESRVRLQAIGGRILERVSNGERNWLAN